MKFINKLNITKILILLIALLLGVNKSWGQKYSIDNGKIKRSGRVGIAYRLKSYKDGKRNREDVRFERKQDRAVRKGKRKHIKKFQTKSTQKEMKQLYRSAVRINKQKPQDYLHQRVYKGFSEGSKTTFIKTKLFLKNRIDNIITVFRNNTTFEKNSKKDFKISKN